MRSLPRVVSKIPNDLRQFLEKVREYLSEGGGDQFVTKNQLLRGGIIGTTPGGEITPPTVPGISLPTVPVSLNATGFLGTIVLTWGAPDYLGHMHTEIWSASTNDFSAKTLIGTAEGTSYSDAVGSGATKYYWIRFVNKNNVAGPYNSAVGTAGFASTDPSYLLDVLSGSITEAELYADLNTRLNQIEINTSQINVLQAEVNDLLDTPEYDNATTYQAGATVTYEGGLYQALQETTGNLPTDETYWVRIGDYSSLGEAVAALAATTEVLTEELAAEVTARETLAARVTVTEGDIATNTAAIQTEASTRASADTALTTQITTATSIANSKNKSYRQNTPPSGGLVTGDIWFDSDDSNKAYYWNGTAWIATDDTRIAANTAAIQTEATTRADADSALTTQVTTAVSIANSKNKSYRQASAPDTDLVAGDIWFDSDDSNKAYRWNGTAWVATDDTRIAANTAAIQTEATTRADADSALATQITTLTSTVNSNTAAIQTEATARADADSALTTQVNTAIAIADAKNKSYRQASAPDTDLVVGDLWFDSDDNNKAYRWDGTAWVATDDTRIASNAAAIQTEATARADADSALTTQITTATSIANAKNKSYRQASAPSVDLVSGDIWFDSDDNNKAYRWDGSAWVATDDARISANAAAIQTEATTRADADSALTTQVTTATSIANSKNKSYRQASAPDTDLVVGDLWFDSDDNNKAYRWNGTAWAATDDARISANTAAIQTEATTRADADTALATQITTLASTVSNNTAAIQTEATTRADADSALATQINTLASTVSNNTAAIQTEATARADADTALTTQITTATSIANSKNKSYRQASAPNTDLVVGDLWFDSDDSNKAYRWDGTAWVITDDTRISANTAAIQTEATTRADADSALATSISTLTTTVNGNTASIQTNTTSINGVRAQNTIQINNNGFVSGYGLISTLDSGGAATSDFIVNVNRFAVTAPETSIPLRANSTAYAVGRYVKVTGVDDRMLVCKVAGTSGGSVPSVGAIGTLVTDGTVTWQVASRIPFAVLTTSLTANGATLTPGVYIDGASILNATINNAQIGDAQITTAKIADTIQSTNYVANTSGWQINKAGTAEFRNVKITGEVQATSGTFTGTVSGSIILGGSATNYSTGVGLFAGLDSGTYKFRVGDPTADYFRWTGSALEINGEIIGTGNIKGRAVTTADWYRSIDNWQVREYATLDNAWYDVTPAVVTVSADEEAFISLTVNMAFGVRDGTFYYRIKAGDHTGTIRAIATSNYQVICCVGDGGLVIAGVGGQDWTRGRSNTTATLYGVTYCFTDKQFVAVGAGGIILTSPNGLDWTIVREYNVANPDLLSVHTPYDYQGISYPAPTHDYVAVGKSGTILTSPNGVTWTTRTSGTTAELRDVAYAWATDPGSITTPGWTAVGVGGVMRYSSDGVTWTTRTSGTTADINCIVFNGNDAIIAGCSYNAGLGAETGLLYSTNGSTWVANYTDSNVTANIVDIHATASNVDDGLGTTRPNSVAVKFVTTNGFIRREGNGIGSYSQDTLTGLPAGSTTMYAIGGIVQEQYLGKVYDTSVKDYYLVGGPSGVIWYTTVSSANTWRALSASYSLNGQVPARVTNDYTSTSYTFLDAYPDTGNNTYQLQIYNLSGTAIVVSTVINAVQYKR